jgi:hypothetical protein
VDEFDQFDKIPLVTSMIKPKIPSANEAPYLCNEHHKKTINGIFSSLSSFPTSACPWVHMSAFGPTDTLSKRKKIRGHKLLAIFRGVVHHGIKT